jgi:hypothetical protein
MRGVDLLDSLEEPLNALYNGGDRDQDADTQSTRGMLLSPEDEQVDDYFPSYHYEMDDEQAFPQIMSRSKKWQYPDPLQHCVQISCQGQSGVHFYTCVYKNCIAAVAKKTRFLSM